MPHVIIYTNHSQLSKGPTFVANTDELLLDYLCAQQTTAQIDPRVDEPPHSVLDKLEQRGYRVVAMSGNATVEASTYVWTLHKPEEIEPYA